MYWHCFCEMIDMNTKNFCISVLLVATLGGVAYAQSMPESQVSSPVEESVSLDRTSLDAKNASWEQKRAERRAAREKILSRLRESSSQEKAMMREVKYRRKRPASAGNSCQRICLGIPENRRRIRSRFLRLRRIRLCLRQCAERTPLPIS